MNKNHSSCTSFILHIHHCPVPIHHRQHRSIRLLYSTYHSLVVPRWGWLPYISQPGRPQVGLTTIFVLIANHSSCQTHRHRHYHPSSSSATHRHRHYLLRIHAGPSRGCSALPRCFQSSRCLYVTPQVRFRFESGSQWRSLFLTPCRALIGARSSGVWT